MESYDRPRPEGTCNIEKEIEEDKKYRLIINCKKTKCLSAKGDNARYE